MTRRPLAVPFSEDDGKGMRLVGRSEIKVVIGNILSEDFLVDIFGFEACSMCLTERKDVMRLSRVGPGPLWSNLI